jgi:hypothetical protein
MEEVVNSFVEVALSCQEMMEMKMGLLKRTMREKMKYII